GAALRMTEFYRDESCGKCTPCREGTYWLTEIYERLEHGRGKESDIDLLMDICDNIGGKSFCPLGDAATSPITSSIKLFREKDELVHLTIDDIPVAVPPGTLVWAAAREAGIEVPIYCYHPKMPPLGACRMCFVEIEKMPKPPQTACTTPVSEGMIVHTKTEKV